MSAARTGRTGALLLGVEVAVTLCIVAVLWMATAGSTSVFVPPLSRVAERFAENYLVGTAVLDLLRTLARLGIAFAIAVVIGVSMGLLFGLSRTVRLMSQPVVTFLRAIPPPALVPLAFVVLGSDDQMIVALAVFVCVWPIVLNTQDGVAEIDPTMSASARAYGVSGMRRLVDVVLPAISPRIFAGMRVSLSFAFIIVIVAEIMAATQGLGYLLTRARTSFNMPDMWAGIVMIGIVGYATALLLIALEHRLLRWHRLSKAGAR